VSAAEAKRNQGCALVTGASRGIGAAVARALAEDGWPVAVNYRQDANGAQAVVEETIAAGHQALEIQADVADERSVEGMFNTVEDRFGPVLVLVNNAGVRHDRLIGGLSKEDWNRVIDVNLGGAFHTISRAIGPMVRLRFGRIINMSSISATRPLPGQAAYASTKAALEALTRTVAQEVARRGVTVNAIAPGLVATDFIPELMKSPEAARAVPARRLAEPQEVASLVRFLASDEAAYITGAVTTVDGGFSAGFGAISRNPRQSTSVEAKRRVEG
jgi:3-oxoacyl-[acyl-carrier protein] reductase